jgi:molybdopterin biosynthesis enzyme
MLGAAGVDRPRAPVVLPDGYKKPPGRAHYLRAWVVRDGARLVAALHPQQGSHMLTSVVGIDALVEIEAGGGDIAPGETATAILLRAV